MQKWMLIEDTAITTGGSELLARWQQNDSGILWIDIEGSAEPADRELLIDGLGLPEAEVGDALLDRHPPTFDENDKHFFMLLKFLDAESNTLDFNTQQMAVFTGHNFVVTRHNKHSPYLHLCWNEIADGVRTLTSPYQMPALVARRMIKRYGRVLLQLEVRLNVLEDELMENLDESHMQELVGYNTALRKMRRILSYHVDVTHQLAQLAQRRELNDWIDDYEEVASQTERFNSLAELYQNVINDLIEGYISLNAHRLNQVMKVLTVVTVVFLPLSLLVGMYGMNFDYIPELKHRYGYFILLGVMGSIAAALIMIFKRLKWL